MSSVTYESIEKAVSELPLFEIPYDYRAVQFYLNNNRSREEYNDDIEDITQNKNIDCLLNSIKYELGNNPKFMILRSGAIIYTPDPIEEGMIRCNDCGRIWDGNAQCDCYRYW